MTLYIGVDFHPYQQTIAFCNAQDGEIKYRQFMHKDKQALGNFYRQCPKDSIVGVEATGALARFEKLLFEMGLELRIGNPALIRRSALSRHKNDYRDAETILDLLMSERFPKIAPRSERSREILQLLGYRQTLVRQRTMLANQLPATARSTGLEKFSIKAKSASARLLAAVAEPVQKLLPESRLTLSDELTARIKQLEVELEKEAAQNEQAGLLLTHSGIGRLTALALVHTLGDVNRFRRKEEVVAFVGLDPLERSAGERKRIGQIGKHGSRLLRYLLVEAGQTTRDPGLKEHYKQVSRRRGRPTAKVAVARKLLINCYLMLCEQIGYEEFRRRGEVGLRGQDTRAGNAIAIRCLR